MEVSIFPKPSVSSLKAKFVEARLHADTEDEDLNARIAELIKTVAKSPAQPIYVAMDPATEKEVTRFKGAVLGSPKPFADFLKHVIGELEGSH